MKILGRLEIAEFDDKNWEVLQPLVVTIAEGLVLTVPKGFISDLTSTPRVFWCFFPPTGKYQKAAVVHDWLYAANGPDVSRGLADRVFLDIMASTGVSALTRKLLWLGVRIGGSYRFKRRDRRVECARLV